MSEKEPTVDIGTSGTKEKTAEGEHAANDNKDFKLCEIWVRDGRIMLDAPPGFWMDKLRSVGILSYCIDIVKGWKEDRPVTENIVKAKPNFMQNLRSHMGRKGVS